MPGKITGIDVSPHAIAAVQVESSLKGFQITACSHVPGNDEINLENAMGIIAVQADFKSDSYHSALPAKQIAYRNLRLPFKDSKKIRQTLPFEIESMVPFPVGDLQVDFLSIDRAEQTEILTAALDKSKIQDHLDLLQSQDFDPDILDVRGVPLVLCLLKQTKTPDNGLFLQLDQAGHTMVLFYERRIVLVRSFPAESPDNPWEAEEKESPGPDSSESLKKLCTDVRNTIHSFCTLHKKEIFPEKIFYAGSPPLPGTDEFLGRFFERPTEKVNLSRSGKVTMGPAIAEVWDPDIFDNALALAIRDSRKESGFNFRQNEFKKKKQYFGSKEEIRRAAVFLIVLICFLGANIGSDHYFLKQRHTYLAREITEITRSTFPDKQIPPGMEYQFFNAEIKQLKDEVSSNPSVGTKTGILDLLKEISQKIPQSLDVKIRRMVADGETVRLSGITDTFNTVEQIKNNLEASSVTNTVTISSSKRDTSGEKVEFEIKLERAI